MKLSDLENNEFDFYSKTNPHLDEFRNKTILITGYKGLIGSGLTKWFLYLNNVKKLNTKLVLSSRNPSVLPNWISNDDLNISFCKFGSEDLAFSASQKLDFIFHFASPTNKTFFVEQPVETIQSIINETHQLLDLAREKHSVFIYASSVEIYGSPISDKPLSETFLASFDPDNIRNSYPIGKLVSEYLCNAYFTKYGVDIRIIRPSSLQGLFQDYSETRIHNQILQCVIENKDLIMITDGSSKKSMIYSMDAINAILFIASVGQSGEKYNITNPDLYYSMKELCQNVFKTFAPNLKVICKNSSQKSFLDRVEYNLDISKLTKLSWKPYRNLYDIYSFDLKRFKIN